MSVWSIWCLLWHSGRGSEVGEKGRSSSERRRDERVDCSQSRKSFRPNEVNACLHTLVFEDNRGRQRSGKNLVAKPFSLADSIKKIPRHAAKWRSDSRNSPTVSKGRCDIQPEGALDVTSPTVPRRLCDMQPEGAQSLMSVHCNVTNHSIPVELNNSIVSSVFHPCKTPKAARSNQT